MHISRRAVLGAGAASAAVLAGCASNTATATQTPASAASASAQLAATLDRAVAGMLHRSPERCTSLGLTEERAGYKFIDKVSDASKAGARDYRAMLQSALTELGAIERNGLSAQEAVTLDVVTTSFRNSVDSGAFEVGGGAGAPYVVTQLNGAYRSMPNFLNEQHPLRTIEEADGYLARIGGFAGQLDQETAIIAEDAGAGVIPPDFVIDKALLQLDRFAEAAPNRNAIVQSLVRRLPEANDIPVASRASYIANAEAAVRDSVLPAVQRQVAALQRIRPQAVHDAGIWRLPRGAEMYVTALRSRTTTTMTPDEIHDTGLELIAQFNSEMDGILRTEALSEHRCRSRANTR
jgi:uncharacterized protein (DUF885 family)